ncbi:MULTISPECIES: hypothetical protein [Clostridium]|uniref:hypothetical protein n=1 Tax=Clostridium TaxID=1485 RepID=UPI0011C92D4C|nr:MULTISPECIES: hypothetical protein [Clostridium]MDU4318689.1 hypothetical protein [Clostridium sp.]
MSKKNVKEENIIKETKYCKIMNQGKVGDDEYTYTIEKIYIKELKRNEVRFCVYKVTRRGDEIYIPRSLDVTELELIELIKESIKNKVFSEEFITMLKQEISKV